MFIGRDDDGAIYGTWTVRQWRDQEELADDDPQVTAFAARIVQTLPDARGFVDELKAAMGGIVASNALARAYPLFYPALQAGNWADLQALVIDARATRALAEPQYQAMKALAAKHHLPLELP